MTGLCRKVRAVSAILLRRSINSLRTISRYVFYATLLSAFLVALFWLGAITASYTDLVPLNPEGAVERGVYLFVSTCFGFAYFTILTILFVWLYPHWEDFKISLQKEIAEEETKIIEREERSAEAGSLSLAQKEDKNIEVLGRRGRTTHIV